MFSPVVRHYKSSKCPDSNGLRAVWLTSIHSLVIRESAQIDNIFYSDGAGISGKDNKFHCKIYSMLAMTTGGSKTVTESSVSLTVYSSPIRDNWYP